MKQRNVRSIGIAGSICGSGVTHLSIALANYAASGLGEKTACLELSRHGELRHWKAVNEKNYFTDAGINQTKHQIVLNVEVTVRILMPGYTSSVAVDSSLAVAETVIVGSVPDTYTYFNSDSVDDVREYVTNQ